MEVLVRVLAIEQPNVQVLELSETEVIVSDAKRSLGQSFYGKNKYGLWEAYLKGPAYERGKTFGILAKNEVVSQEESFIAQIRTLIPNEWFLKTLKYGVVFFNRNLDDHISEELQQEIFGVSESFSDEFDFIGNKYDRILNYHAAHDIGHALQDLSIVGCTSFAVWNEHSADSSLLIGRNFDFYMGDDFAKNKLILFVEPDSGYAFASVTWAGFMGVVSGMNEHGLTVTLNAAKSTVPTGAKTPISLLAREILQYAKNIDEAFVIANSRETFVSESILIGSAEDGKAAIIEKSPDKIDIFLPKENGLTCSNHYQSDAFKDNEANLENIKLSDSKYRYDRMNQLLALNIPVDVQETASMLRNQKGLNEAELGLGNPKAINQLLAHHGIIFQPEKRLMWVSANPFQLGEFVCYDLNSIFYSGSDKSQLSVDSLTLSADTFLESDEFDMFLRYKELKNLLFSNIALGKSIEWNGELEEEFVASNPESYVTYFMLGDYYLELGKTQKAAEYYQISLSKEVASVAERNKIEENLKACR